MNRKYDELEARVEALEEVLSELLDDEVEDDEPVYITMEMVEGYAEQARRGHGDTAALEELVRLLYEAVS